MSSFSLSLGFRGLSHPLLSNFLIHFRFFLPTSLKLLSTLMVSLQLRLSVIGLIIVLVVALELQLLLFLILDLKCGFPLIFKSLFL